MPALETARNVVRADLWYYTIGSREEFALAYSGESFFTSDQGVATNEPRGRCAVR